MINEIIEFSPSFFDTPNLRLIIGAVSATALVLWSLVAHDIYWTESAPKLWQK